MNYDFEDNNSKKKRAEEESNFYPGFIVTKKRTDNDIRGKRLRNGGFVGWPHNKLSAPPQDADSDILEDRLRDGGYVAYPKNK